MKKIAILGHGVVGYSTAEMLEKNTDRLRELIGEDVEVKYILDRREMPHSPWYHCIIRDFQVILEDKDICLVVEALGGLHPAYEYSLAALRAGKHVVTSNKACVSKFGATLLRTAETTGVSYRFEASCGGGIPLLSPMLRDLRHNHISSVAGILNGTTNYILTRMKENGLSFDDALKEAQEKGYAEHDPTADIEGRDVCRKINIITALLDGKLLDEKHISTEGITHIRDVDVTAADQAGYAIKLLGRYFGGVRFVAPHLIPFSSPLAHVNGVNNGILVHGDYVGDVMFYGQGAGGDATASAVVADVVSCLLSEEAYPIPTHSKHPQDMRSLAFPRYLVTKEEHAKQLEEALPCTFTALPTMSGEFACLTPCLTEEEIEELKKQVPLMQSLRVFVC